jgi:uroporphyrin-III C-methyltransferase
VTLVIYMGVATVESVQAGCSRAAARDAGRGGAARESAGRAAAANDADPAGRAVRADGLGSPSIIVVGDVLRAAPALRVTLTEARAA